MGSVWGQKRVGRQEGEYVIKEEETKFHLFSREESGCMWNEKKGKNNNVSKKIYIWTCGNTKMVEKYLTMCFRWGKVVGTQEKREKKLKIIFVE